MVDSDGYVAKSVLNRRGLALEQIGPSGIVVDDPDRRVPAIV